MDYGVFLTRTEGVYVLVGKVCNYICYVYIETSQIADFQSPY